MGKTLPQAARLQELLKPSQQQVGESPVSAPTAPPGKADWNGLGIALFAHTRDIQVRNTLESLARQDALHITNVFIDGDQGRPDIRREIDKVAATVSDYPVKRVVRLRSGFGFRKMIITYAREMAGTYERLIFLEDDCFPTRFAVSRFDESIKKIEHNPGVFSVYGHPFSGCGRRRKLASLSKLGLGAQQLLSCLTSGTICRHAT